MVCPDTENFPGVLDSESQAKLQRQIFREPLNEKNIAAYDGNGTKDEFCSFKSLRSYLFSMPQWIVK